MATTDLTVIIGAKDRASEVMKGTTGNFQKYGKQIGAALTAAGAAGLKLAGDSKKLTGQLNTTALGLGVTTGELRNLTAETANVTFPIKEVMASFDLLTRAGMDDSAQMAKSATAFDTLGDAIGKPASAVTKSLIPAFKAFNIGLEDAGKHTDAFTWLTRNTTIGLDEFSSAMSYLAPDIDTLGLSMEDTVAIMAALEAKGISGSAATREFRTAVTAAANGESSLTGALGLTSEELAIYQGELANSTGLTDEYAEAANAQYGTIDKLKHSMSELTFKMGANLEPLEGMFAGMTALGPVIMLASTSMGANTMAVVKNKAALVAHKVAMVAGKVVTLGVTAAQWLLNAAVLAFPLVAIVAAVLAVIAVGVLLWKNWDKVTEFLGKAWDTIKSIFIDTITAIKEKITGTFGTIIDFVKEVPGKIAGFFEGIGTSIMGFFTAIPEKISTLFSGIVDFVREIPGKITGFFSGIGTSIVDFFVSIPEKLGELFGSLPDLAKSPINAVIGIFNGMLDRISGLKVFELKEKKVFGKTVFPGWTLKLPSIDTRLPVLDTGAIVREPTLAALAMNRKPEAVVPLDRMDRFGGNNAIIHINLDGESIASYAVNLLTEEVRLQGVF